VNGFLLLLIVSVLLVMPHSDAFASKISKLVCGDRLCSEPSKCKEGQIREPATRICRPGSDGWKITGYFAPLEHEYLHDAIVPSYILGTRNNGTFDYIEGNSTYYLEGFKKAFVEEIAVQGAGITATGAILQSWQDDFIFPDGIKTRFYHYGNCMMTSSGVCLPLKPTTLYEPLIMVAVTLGKTGMGSGVIEHGTILKILDIPPPWNTKKYWAVDTGEWRDKHIDVFTGYGLSARDTAFMITKLPPEQDSRVIIIGYKEPIP
jgi:hypothetical protein